MSEFSDPWTIVPNKPFSYRIVGTNPDGTDIALSLTHPTREAIERVREVLPKTIPGYEDISNVRVQSCIWLDEEEQK